MIQPLCGAVQWWDEMNVRQFWAVAASRVQGFKCHLFCCKTTILDLSATWFLLLARSRLNLWRLETQLQLPFLKAAENTAAIAGFLRASKKVGRHGTFFKQQKHATSNFFDRGPRLVKYIFDFISADARISEVGILFCKLTKKAGKLPKFWEF